MMAYSLKVLGFETYTAKGVVLARVQGQDAGITSRSLINLGYAIAELTPKIRVMGWVHVCYKITQLKG